jgi:SAM-dependent methyltransferase
MCALYLKYRTDVSDKKQQMIHFAPERSLSKFIIREDKFIYLTADLYMSPVDLKLDIEHMSACEDAQFDCFLCSHVLEHVVDDIKAMKELYRILKPGGWGVVMSPIIPSLEMTYEDFSLTTPKERLRHFGQKDHVRVYAKNDFIKKLENAGFHVIELSHEFFGGETFRRSGISPDSVLYVVEKPAQ